MTESAKSLTRAMYHLRTGKEYLEAFKLDTEGISKLKCNGWLNKLNFIENDVFSLLTDESREHFRQEIKRGDILFFAEASTLFLHLSENQRAFIEELMNMMIKGEQVKIVEDKNEAA